MTILVNGVLARIDETGLEWTLSKLLKGAGVGSDPTEIDATVPTIVRKTADEIVNNSIVPQDDDELFLPLLANEVYEGKIYIYINSSVAADMRLQMTLPAGCVGWGEYAYIDSAAANQWQLNLLTTLITLQGVASDKLVAVIHFLVINGANAGNMQIQWAQGTAEVSDTKMLANSCIVAHRLA